ncbi:acyl-CoA-binding protein [Flammeovirga yaeyamensis]|uniref:Acyl-CoA-binding protein n=1 Tax=Flammeovirga yaeyamensis TaxID=367791 RepID=A0AAX1N7E1_9BACT|nr:MULTISPECIES: acyl-CoA-binding protein [Flammeovirga]ANQ49040.1 acyl-CoA-binding protein [Flammeovirga sp. MY04]MBB3699121.1 diazepam-binding inhibitor (GABA receptor modulating acyl-CoA-binding protein) [Flammeovirga yaeyamensis]NMF36554.1 acyl-CoA-binding protein [Flammeovirga yaeyamensis]QWG03489.1 acyl-CoA-binding protein [Flammeovirga yaeyamensis]
MASEAFKDAQTRVNNLPERPSNDDLLKLYAFFKQATEGDVNTERPGGFDFKGNAKWDAWDKIKGMSADDAESQYVLLVNQLEGN